MLCRETKMAAVTCLAIFMSTVAHSQEQADVAAGDDPRGRFAEIEFHEGEKVRKLGGTRADKKYAAIVSVSSLAAPQRMDKLLGDWKLDDRFTGSGISLFHYEGKAWSPSTQSLTEVFDGILDAVSLDDESALPGLGFFKAEELHQLMDVSHHQRPGPITAFSLYAASEEEAKEAARTLLFLLEHGVKQPIVDELTARVAKTKAQVDELDQAREQLEHSIAELKEEISQQVAIPEGEQNALRSEMRSLEIKLSGIRAKSEVLERVRKQRASPGDDAWKGRIDDLWLTTQVEFAENEAMRATLEEFVKAADKLRMLRNRLNALENNLRTQDLRRVGASSMLKEYSAVRETTSKLFTVVTATIHPIEWQSNSDFQFE